MKQDRIAEKRYLCRFKGVQFPFSPNSRIMIPLAHYIEIRNRLLKFQPDVIHIVTEFTIGNEGLRLAKETKLPLVMSYHTNIEQYLTYFHAKFIEKPVRAYFQHFHSFADLNLCPSRQTFLQLQKQSYHNLAIWTRGVDTKLYSPDKRLGRWRHRLGEDKFLCLYVGRLSYEKGLGDYLEAIHRINQILPNNPFLFVFAGDGPYREVIEKAGVDNICLTGFVKGEELAQLYADSDLFVFPSGTETFGNVLLEAMASGLPCICTDTGGVTDFAEDGRNACVYPYQNVQVLVDKILSLHSNMFLREKIISGAKRTVMERQWDRVMDELMESYEYVLALYKSNENKIPS